MDRKWLMKKKLGLVIIGALSLSACGGDGDSPPATSSELPSSGEVSEEQLLASGTSQGGYYTMTIDSDNDLTLITDEFTLSSSDSGEPQKLVVAGKLTISNN